MRDPLQSTDDLDLAPGWKEHALERVRAYWRKSPDGLVLVLFFAAMILFGLVKAAIERW